MIVCHLGGRSAAVAGFLHPVGADRRRERGRRHGRVGAWRSADQTRNTGTGRGRAPWLRSRASVRSRRRTASEPGARLRLVGECPADDDQDDEVEGARAGGVQVAELLADLAVDLQARDGRPEWAELEERGLRRGVGAQARVDDPLRRLAADDEYVGPGHERGSALEADRQVTLRQMEPLGDVPVGRGDRPVQLLLRPGVVVTTGQVQRAIGIPARGVVACRRQVGLVADGPLDDLAFVRVGRLALWRLGTERRALNGAHRTHVVVATVQPQEVTDDRREPIGLRPCKAGHRRPRTEGARRIEDALVGGAWSARSDHRRR